MKNVKKILFLGIMLVNMMPLIINGNLEWITQNIVAQDYNVEYTYDTGYGTGSSEECDLPPGYDFEYSISSGYTNGSNYNCNQHVIAKLSGYDIDYVYNKSIQLYGTAFLNYGQFSNVASACGVNIGNYCPYDICSLLNCVKYNYAAVVQAIRPGEDHVYLLYRFREERSGAIISGFSSDYTYGSHFFEITSYSVDFNQSYSIISIASK